MFSVDEKDLLSMVDAIEIAKEKCINEQIDVEIRYEEELIMITRFKSPNFTQTVWVK